jgi:TonB-linked SusC/RagA family outer membrane protein
MTLRQLWSDLIRRSSRVVVLLVVLAPVAARAQETTVTGRVTAAGSNEPLGDARVMVLGSSLAAVTNPEGRYTLRNAPTGTLEIRVLRVGFNEQKKTVTVTRGAQATLDFTMSQAVVQLQEVVTTATGEQRKVELGNALSTISAPQRVEETPVTNIADLLVAKAPGVIMDPPNMTGAAPVIRIRGLNSLSLSNAPIMIVDGVRYFSSSVSGGVGGTNISLMNNLSPEEIEDIEIVKGPSAATLYGTDAANGVIVVTTRKGKAGSARWSWFAEPGVVDDRNNYPSTYAIWGHNPTTGKISRCELATMTPTTCVSDSVTSVNIAKDASVSPIVLGNNTNFGGQVTGGSDAVRYFVSGDHFNEVGPYKMPDFAQSWLVDTTKTALRDEWVHPEAFQRVNFRSNLTAAISPQFDLNMSAGFSKTDQRLPQVDNNVNGIGGAMYLTYGTNHAGLDYNPVGSLGEGLHGYARYTPATMFQFLTEQGNQRITGSADANWRPFNWMQNQATFGIDLVDATFFQLCRFGECPVFGSNRLGTATDNHNNNRAFTGRLVSNSKYNPKTWMNFTTTFGADYLNNEGDNSNARGVTLPPGAQTVGAGATQTASDGQPTATKTLGVYAQEQLGLRDRMYVIAAVRSDQNSAFGANFQRVFYPKVSLSWLLSDETWFPHVPLMNSFRLRSAYGQSGVQPGATDALRTFSANTVNIASVNTSGLSENALGNPNLKPETSGEFEGGFDTRIWDNKLNLELTYYNKKTKNALISLPIAPSAAPSATSVRANLGSVENSGFESQITATLYESRRLGWNMTLSASHTSGKVASLGLDPAGRPNKTIGTGQTRDSVGFPVNGLFVRPFHYTDANHDGIIQASEVTVDTGVVYRGYSYPRDLVSVQNGFDLFNRKLRLNVLLDYKGGFNLFNNTMEFICQQAPQSCDEDEVASLPLWRQARSVAQNYGTVVNGTKFTTQAGYWENGQFWRLREVSATFDLPQVVANRIRARDANITFGARNLHVWTKYTEVDPESNYSTGDVQTDFITTAPRTYFTFRLNLHY